MRSRRMKLPPKEPLAFYHCLSRIVDKRFIFGDDEKICFLKLLREYEAFCGVRVLTYCIMSNHFHLLVEVPSRPSTPPSAEEIISLLKGLSANCDPEGVAQRIAMYRSIGDSEGETAYLETFRRRMWDISWFVRLVKQRFTQWYNGRNERSGTLWERRFKSVLVDGTGLPIATVAAYIDLNPVRANLVDNPQDYPWCGYAEASKQVPISSQSPLHRLAQAIEGPHVPLEQSFKTYHRFLYLEGDESRSGTEPDGQPSRRGFDRNQTAQILSNNGTVPLPHYLRCRVRFFSDGTAIGGRSFVESVFAGFRSQFGAARKTGAHPVRGLPPGPNRLYNLRRLQRDVFG